MQKYPGLRPLREDPWECLANFICSSLKQIVQIRQIHASLRQTFGGPANSFPSATTLAQAGESALRSCALGYRARHLLATAKRVATQPSCLISRLHFQRRKPQLISKPCPESDRKSHVVSFYTRMGAGTPFRRCLGRSPSSPTILPQKRKALRLADLETWSHQKFGPNRGIAQLLLFHWFRHQPKTPPEGRSTRPRLRRSS